MNAEFSGIERRLDELSERLARLEPLQNKSLEEFNADPYLKEALLPEPLSAGDCKHAQSNRNTTEVFRALTVRR